MLSRERRFGLIEGEVQVSRIQNRPDPGVGRVDRPPLIPQTHSGKLVLPEVPGIGVHMGSGEQLLPKPLIV